MQAIVTPLCIGWCNRTTITTQSAFFQFTFSPHQSAFATAHSMKNANVAALLCCVVCETRGNNDSTNIPTRSVVDHHQILVGFDGCTRVRRCGFRHASHTHRTTSTRVRRLVARNCRHRRQTPHGKECCGVCLRRQRCFGFHATVRQAVR